MGAGVLGQKVDGTAQLIPPFAGGGRGEGTFEVVPGGNQVVTGGGNGDGSGNVDNW
ncbi:hypothetical protein [Candidatus Allofournierella merdavium]|uniref:hypothetical protein n=1 Tax=Candidatus Allofournierella merdavium TaxID=2838593 RepID=UPI00374E9B3C